MTSNTGKLKEEIRRVFPELKLKVETWIIPYINEVLDEAKKEFPKGELRKTGNSPYASIWILPTTQDYEKWFTKWFGTGDTK